MTSASSSSVQLDMVPLSLSPTYSWYFCKFFLFFFGTRKNLAFFSINVYMYSLYCIVYANNDLFFTKDIKVYNSFLRIPSTSTCTTDRQDFLAIINARDFFPSKKPNSAQHCLWIKSTAYTRIFPHQHITIVLRPSGRVYRWQRFLARSARPYSSSSVRRRRRTRWCV